jgi:hypothetical protein
VYTEQLTQRLAITAPVNPQVVNNATKTTGGVDMQQSRRAFFVLEIGAVTGGGSINAKLQESTDNSSFTDLSGNNVSMTALTTANKQYTFEVRAGQLTKRYVRLSLTETGSQNVNVCAVGWGDEGVHKPDNANNDASVVTQNVVS